MGGMKNSVIVSTDNDQTTFEMIAADTDRLRWNEEMRVGAWRPYRAKFDWSSRDINGWGAGNSNANLNFYRWIVRDVHSTWVDTIRVRLSFLNTDPGMPSSDIEQKFSEEFAFDDPSEFLTILGILLYNHKNGGECHLLQDGYPNGINYFFVKIPEGMCKVECVFLKDKGWNLEATLCDMRVVVRHTKSVRVLGKCSKWYYSAFLRNRRQGDL